MDRDKVKPYAIVLCVYTLLTALLTYPVIRHINSALPIDVLTHGLWRGMHMAYSQIYSIHLLKNQITFLPTNIGLITILRS
jgi:hypothetical protein